LDLYKDGNEVAKNVLIERNLRLVAHIVKKYSNLNSDMDDLISIGTIGLIKGITSFDPNKFDDYGHKNIHFDELADC